MQKTIRKGLSTPSIKLGTLVVIQIVTLLVVALGILFFFIRQVLVDATKSDAEQRLEGTLQQVDNILLDVEHSTGNFYYELQQHLDQPEYIENLCRKLVESTPDIFGCAIAFKPDYFPNSEAFLTYVYRKHYNSPELIAEKKVNDSTYLKHKWYKETVESQRPSWIDPGNKKNRNLEPLIAFCLPIIDLNKECIGVMGVGLSVNLLSQFVLETKPTPNSYSVLLAHDGTYIIHPIREKLAGHSVLQQPEIRESPSALQAAKTMLKGETGETEFTMNGNDWYMFYKPFMKNDVIGRSMERLNWSIATIYPSGDIFGEYNHLVLHILAFVLGGLIVFYLLCRIVINMQFRPLSILTESAQSIAEGTYTTIIPDTDRTDEIGMFQQHFKRMQQALLARVTEKKQLAQQLQEQRDNLRCTQQQITRDEHVQKNFLHNVTNRMIRHAQIIKQQVDALCDNYQTITPQDAQTALGHIKEQSNVIIELLDEKFDKSNSEEEGGQL